MTTPPPPPAPGPDPSTEARLAHIERMLAAGVPTTHSQAEAHTERRLDRPDEVREQVQAALRQAERDRTATAAQAEQKTAHETLAERVKKLEEVKPESPLRAIEQFMGWAAPNRG